MTMNRHLEKVLRTGRLLRSSRKAGLNDFIRFKNGRRCRGMGYIIAFISGAIVGVILMCVLQISSKNVQEDEEQEKYLKDLNDKHWK